MARLSRAATSIAAVVGGGRFADFAAGRLGDDFLVGGEGCGARRPG